MSTAQATAKQHEFSADMKQLMKIVTSALYSNRDIFIRELLSNACDANEKCRFGFTSGQFQSDDESALTIKVGIDAKAKTLTIADTGIGMNHDELIANLGTIAHSGTRAFLEQCSQSQSQDADANKGQLIGQFGVGFYSAFVVADRVTLHTRRVDAGENESWLWESDGSGCFSITPKPKSQRGTVITMYLKDEHTSYLDGWKVEQVIKQYSDYLPYDIELSQAHPEPSQDDKQDAKIPEPRIINHGKAIWLRSKKSVTEEQYKSFFSYINGMGDPLAWTHNHVEGKLEYKTLLYIPEQAPFDLWHREHKRGLKLYVNRVFIMDKVEQFLPMYLRFIVGVVDSSDLDLNVSREILQNSPAIDTIKSACVKRVLGMLKSMSEQDNDRYQRFWDQYGQVMKEGVGEDFANKEALLKLYRFASTNGQDQQNVSFDDYISRMNANQEHIYYLIAETYEAAKDSPHLERLLKKGVEVLLLSDRVDEWLVSHVNEYEGKTLKSVTKGDLGAIGDQDDDKAKARSEQAQKNHEPVLDRVKKALGDQVKDVQWSSRLADSPSCIIADEADLSMNLKRMLKDAGQAMPDVKPILELNPEHVFMSHLTNEQSEAQFDRWAQVLLDSAMLAEGGKLDNPSRFVKSFNALIEAML